MNCAKGNATNVVRGDYDVGGGSPISRACLARLEPKRLRSAVKATELAAAGSAAAAAAAPSSSSSALSALSAPGTGRPAAPSSLPEAPSSAVLKAIECDGGGRLAPGC